MYYVELSNINKVMNKYKKWYVAITTVGKALRDGYTEKHHILPKSLGGDDSIENLTDLTAREHFICHWLLTKIYPTGEAHWKMINAFRMMQAENSRQQRYKTKVTARVYENLKEEYSMLQSERYSGEKNPMYGDKFYRSAEGTERQRAAVTGENNGAKQLEARAKISASKLGKKRKPFSKEWRGKLSASKQGENNNRFGINVSEDTKKKISESLSGRKQDPEVVVRRAETQRALNMKREKKQCPHCNQLVAVNGYARWHGDNCKLKTE
jgi:hypothetical protein